MADEDVIAEGHSRRDVLRKAAVVGAAAWAAPLVTSSSVLATGGATPKCVTTTEICVSFNPFPNKFLLGVSGEFTFNRIYLLRPNCVCSSGVAEPGCLLWGSFQFVGPSGQLTNFVTPAAPPPVPGGGFTVTGVSELGVWTASQALTAITVCEDRIGRPIASRCVYDLGIDVMDNFGLIEASVILNKTCDSLLDGEAPGLCAGAPSQSTAPGCAGSVTG